MQEVLHQQQSFADFVYCLAVINRGTLFQENREIARESCGGLFMGYFSGGLRIGSCGTGGMRCVPIVWRSALWSASSQRGADFEPEMFDFAVYCRAANRLTNASCEKPARVSGWRLRRSWKTTLHRLDCGIERPKVTNAQCILYDLRKLNLS